MTRTCRPSWLIWLLAATLVVAQGLALMHRVVHAPMIDSVSVVPVERQADTNWVHGLFAGHDDTSCKLLDASSHDAAACIHAAVAILPMATLLAFFAGEVLARRAALAQARGPPAFIR